MKKLFILFIVGILFIGGCLTQRLITKVDKDPMNPDTDIYMSKTWSENVLDKWTLTGAIHIRGSRVTIPEMTQMYLNITYKSGNWLFFDKVEILVGGKKHTWEYESWETNRDTRYGGGISESINITVEHNLWEDINAAILDNKVEEVMIIKLSGNGYHIGRFDRKDLEELCSFYNQTSVM